MRNNRGFAIVAGALAIGAALLWSNRGPAPVVERTIPVALESPRSAYRQEPAVARAIRKRPTAATPQGIQPEFLEPDETLPQMWPGSELKAEEYKMSKMDIFFNLQTQTRDWTIENYTQLGARREHLSGRDAYQLYTYLRSCMNRPRSVESLKDRTDRIRGSERMSAAEIDALAGRMSETFVRCEHLPSDQDLGPLMLDWLTLAANRGFPQAQLAYHLSARWLLQLDPWNAYRYPDRVHEYRRLAPLFLEAAVNAGHSDAFVEYSLALQQRIIFEEDLLAAYAYAVAADLAFHGGNQEARNYMEVLEIVLSPDEIREARRMGRRLCQSFCRKP